MKSSALSMCVFASYMAVLSIILIFYPKAFLLLGFEDVSGPFVPTLGYVIGALSFFYFMAIREQAKNFYRWTVIARMPLFPFFVLLVVIDIAPPIMILIGAWDSGCALWTRYALKHD